MVQPARGLVCALLLITMIGAASLSSPPPPREQSITGRQPSNPVVAALASFFAIGYTAPTEPATQIKALFLRGGATMIAVVALIAWGLSVRRPVRPISRLRKYDAVAADERELLLAGSGDRNGLFAWRRPGLLGIATLLATGWLAWSAVASFWSHSRPTASLFVQSFAFVLALAAVPGVVLSRRLASRAALVWMSAAAAMACVTIMGRLDASAAGLFTDNGTELAGLLLAAGVLAVVKLTGRTAELVFPDDAADAGKFWPRRFVFVGYLAAAAAITGGVATSGQAAWRTGLLAGAAGLAVAAILLTRRAWRMGWSIAAVVVLGLLAWVVVFRQPTAQPFHPDADQRAVRSDRWSLAWELVRERPIIGHGPWSARLLADSLAERRSLTDPRWANSSIESIDNFWLEQLADVGVVGVLLLSGSLTLVVVAASRAVRQCPYRRHRYLVAAMAGGLVAMAVHELFASALATPGFATVMAGWIGLTAAAAREGGQAQQPAAAESATVDPFVIGFYRGTVFLLTGAAVMLSSVGYLVVKDFSAARTHYIATHENLPRAAEPASLSEVLRRQSGARDQEIIEAIGRLDDAAAWSLDYANRLDASWQRAAAASAHVAMQVKEQLARGAVGTRTPAPLPISAAWVETLVSSMAKFQAVDAIRPAGQPRLAESLAEQCLLLARGRWLSLEVGLTSSLVAEQNVLARADAVLAVRRAGHILDSRLADNAYDLPAALLRLAIADPAGLGRRMLISLASADWLSARASPRLSPIQRLRMLRDAMRDYAVIGSERAQWQLAVGPATWADLWQEFVGAMVRAELVRPVAGGQWDDMLAAAKLVADERQRSARWWIESEDLDQRNAPQTFRLAAELAIVRNFVRVRAGLPAMLPGQDDPLDLADRMFEQAQRLYEQDRRFALQRVMVLLARAQLAWHRDRRAGPSMDPAALHFADDAERALSNVVVRQRASAEHAVAVVKAFLLLEAGRPAEAAEWLARSRVARQVDPDRFRREFADGWRGRLSPVRVDLPEPASQPDSPARIDLSPLYPFHWPIGPMR